jgi:hypothetical protein
MHAKPKLASSGSTRRKIKPPDQRRRAATAGRTVETKIKPPDRRKRQSQKAKRKIKPPD